MANSAAEFRQKLSTLQSTAEEHKKNVEEIGNCIRKMKDDRMRQEESLVQLRQHESTLKDEIEATIDDCHKVLL